MNKKLLVLGVITSLQAMAGESVSPVLKINGVFDGPILPETRSNESSGIFSGRPDMIELRIETSGVLDSCELRISVPLQFPNVPIVLGGLVEAGDFFTITNDAGLFQTYFGVAADMSVGFELFGNETVELNCDGNFIDEFVGSELSPLKQDDSNLKGGLGGQGLFQQGWAHRKEFDVSDARSKGGAPFDKRNWNFSVPGSLSGCTVNNSCVGIYPSGTLPVELMNFSID